MSIRTLTIALLLAVPLASAAAPKSKKTAPPPQEIDVDAIARAKDAPATPPADGAQPAPEAAAAEPAATPEPAAAAEPAAAGSAVDAAATTDAATAAEPSAAESPAAVPDEPPAPQSADDEQKRIAAGCRSRATSLLDAAQKGDFAAATRDFDAQMRGALKPDKFKALWDSLGRFGALTARGESHPSRGDGYYLVMTPLIFEKETLVAQVACGNDGLIAGFHVKPLSAVQ